MKKFLVFIFLVGILFCVYTYRDYIINFIMKNVIDRNEITFGIRNKYYKDFDYGFVQNTSVLEPENKQDILNIIYTTLNRGLDSVTFYCPYSYESCIQDVNDIADNNLYLSSINNLVHPFNSYSNIYFTITDYRRIRIDILRVYSDSFISSVEYRVDSITNSIIKSNMSVYDKIKAYHDYIVDNTVYDSSVSFDNNSEFINNSNNAYGLLNNKKAICSGYSDMMAIFLDKMGLNNYKISSDNHIWNLVYIDGSWKHIDVTWDDPVTNNGSNLLLHDFFLVSSAELAEKDNGLEKDNHSFDSSIYLEAN